MKIPRLSSLMYSFYAAVFARSGRLSAFILLVFTIVFGTVGYMVIEGWSVLDSLYMTMITITTIGFGEPHALSIAGRSFTLVLIGFTVLIIGYAATTIAAFIFDGDFTKIVKGRFMDMQLNKMDNHIILAGCGKVGIHIAEELVKTGEQFVIIESNHEQVDHVTDLLGHVTFVEGDAAKEETLQKAKVEQAKGLIAAVNDDRENIFIVLTARAANPHLKIIARAVEDENIGKLKRAGANEVISPNAIGGLRMASLMIRPKVVSFLDEMLRGDETLRVEEIDVNDYPNMIGSTLSEVNIRAHTGMLVVALTCSDNSYHFNPGADTQLNEGDTLIVIGTPEQRALMRELTHV